MVVAAHVHGPALGRDQFPVDLRLVVGELLGNLGEAGLEFLVLALGGQGLGPVERQVEVAAPVVDLPHLAGRRLVVVEERGDGLVERFRQHRGLRILVGVGNVFQRSGEGGELAEGIPAQVALLLELLDVLGGRAAGARLEEPTTAQQGHDGQHLRAGAQLDDREQVGQVVAQGVTGDGDGVLTGPEPRQRELHRLDGGQDADVQPGRVVVLQVGVHLRDDLGIVRPLRVEPEHGRGAGETGAGDGQLDPILDGRVLGLAHAEDVTGLDLLLHQGCTGGVDNPDDTACGGDEGLVVGAVFLRLLGHQPHIRHGAHRGGIERAVLLAVLDDGLVDRRVAAVRDHGDGVVEFPVRPPHLSRVADDDGHGRIDDDVVRHMEVRDALVRIHHGERGTGLVDGLDVGLDLRPLGFG